jgi:putative membrane protein
VGTLIAFVIRWLILALAVYVAAYLIPGIELVGWQNTLAVALFLGALNLLLKPLLVIISLPITLLTFGLFLLVINTALLLLTEWLINTFTDFEFGVDGLLAAFLGALIISIVTFIVTRFIRPEGILRGMRRPL